MPVWLRIYYNLYKICANLRFLFFCLINLTRIKQIIINSVLIPISDWLILKPKQLDQKKYDEWIAHPFIVNEKIHTQDNEILDAMFYNANKIPTYEDEVIYMYSHGNSGWSGWL